MWKKRRKPNPWVTWEAEPGEVASGKLRHVIPGETLPPDAPAPPPAPAPAPAPEPEPAPPPRISDPVEQIIADFGESPAAPPESPRAQWQAPAQPPVPPPTSSPAGPPPADPPASPPAVPPPSWGRATAAAPGRTADRRVSLRKPPRPRVPELARRLPALRPSRLPVPVRRLPAPPWWVLPAAARWTRRQAPRAARTALYAALVAVAALAGVASVYGLTRVAALRWDIAIPTYAVIAGITARLIREIPRLPTHERMTK